MRSILLVFLIVFVASCEQKHVENSQESNIEKSAADLLLENWTRFHIENKDRPGAKMLQNAHTTGTIDIKEALEKAPQEIRDRIIILAIGPSPIVPRRLCYESYYYANKLDPLRYIKSLADINKNVAFCDGEIQVNFTPTVIIKNEKLHVFDPDMNSKDWNLDFESPIFVHPIQHHFNIYLSQEDYPCQSLVNVESNPQEDIEAYVDEITNKTFYDFKKDFHLYPFGVGSRMRHQIEMLGLSFQYFRELDIPLARKFLILVGFLFEDKINEHEKIRPYLQNYPFKPKNIQITIYIQKPDGSQPDPDKLSVLSLKDEVLSYMVEDAETKKLTTIYQETLMEAARIYQAMIQKK